jgi:hypothetical protein
MQYHAVGLVSGTTQRDKGGKNIYDNGEGSVWEWIGMGNGTNLSSFF